MPRRTLTLTSDERAALEALRDHGDRAYLRERAAALLKIADGTPAAQVARSGLLRRRRCETLYTWLDRFAAEGVQGLLMRPGRGRKPAFSPPTTPIRWPRRRRCWIWCGGIRASAAMTGRAGPWPCCGRA